MLSRHLSPVDVPQSRTGAIAAMNGLDRLIGRLSFHTPSDVRMAHPQTLVFEGRPDRLVPAAMIAYLSFFIAIALLATFTLAVDTFGRGFLGLFEGVLIAFVCVTAIASSRQRTFQVDGKGIRCSGRLRSNFDVSWKDVSRIEVVRHRRGAP